LCAPYATVIDIDVNQLPSADAVAKWSASQMAAAVRHNQQCRDFNPHLRQLLHVAYKIAAKQGQGYLSLVQACETTIARNVTSNLFDRHLRPVFIGSR
jgi:hypothetical protein